jgi:hypothetical protein
VGNACAFLEPSLPQLDREEILIDIWFSDESSPEPLRISLSIGWDEEPGSGNQVTVIGVDSVDPWWTDRIIVSRAHRSIEIVRSMARIVLKIAIRVAPVPAIY